MITSLALIFLIGLAMAGICKAIKVPRIIGLLATGIVLGPYVLDWIDPSILGISAELRKIALIIILIKAGLALNIEDLKKVGRPAILMSFLPATFEIIGYTIFAPLLFGISHLEGALMGTVLGAVSPAVVVPKMVSLMDNKYGTDKKIPQLILAGASMDDVYVIVLFTTFVGMAQGQSAQVMDFVNIPISIVLGILIGVAIGFLVAFLFEVAHRSGHSIRNSFKVIIVLALSFLMIAIETWLEGKVAVSGLLAVMSMSSVIAMRCRKEVGANLAGKFGKLWLAAEVLLFVLVGAAVNIPYTVKAGGLAVAMIFIGLAFRMVGVIVCVSGTGLSFKERLFCAIAYLPKATVQAAIGSIPLSYGLPCGEIILSVAVLAIIITAPLGAFGMDLTYKRLLTHES